MNREWRQTPRWSLIALAVAFCGISQVSRGQTPSTFGIIVEGKLTVGLLGRSPQVLDRSDIAKLPHKAVKVRVAGGKLSLYSGVPLKELLEHVGSVFNTAQQSVNLGSIVVVESVDGPSVVFATAEIDSALTAKRILLADSKDGKSLAAPEGPF